MIKSLFPSKVQYYKGIDDMPIRNWFKINETNDLKWVSKDQSINVSKHVNKLFEAWNKIFDEFIDMFGLPEKMKEILELKREIFVLEAQKNIENNGTLQLFIDIETDKLKELLNTEKEKSTGQARVYVEKFLGFKLNEKETSVKDFYQYIQAMNEQVKSTENGRG